MKGILGRSGQGRLGKAGRSEWRCPSFSNRTVKMQAALADTEKGRAIRPQILPLSGCPKTGQTPRFLNDFASIWRVL